MSRNLGIVKERALLRYDQSGISDSEFICTELIESREAVNFVYKIPNFRVNILNTRK